jgi:hypothetical protein
VGLLLIRCAVVLALVACRGKAAEPEPAYRHPNGGSLEIAIGFEITGNAEAALDAAVTPIMQGSAGDPVGRVTGKRTDRGYVVERTLSTRQREVTCFVMKSRGRFAVRVQGRALAEPEARALAGACAAAELL